MIYRLSKDLIFNAMIHNVTNNSTLQFDFDIEQNNEVNGFYIENNTIQQGVFDISKVVEYSDTLSLPDCQISKKAFVALSDFANSLMHKKLGKAQAYASEFILQSIKCFPIIMEWLPYIQNISVTWSNFCCDMIIKDRGFNLQLLLNSDINSIMYHLIQVPVRILDYVMCELPFSYQCSGFDNRFKQFEVKLESKKDSLLKSGWVYRCPFCKY